MKTIITIGVNKAREAADAINGSWCIARQLEQTYRNKWETRDVDYDDDDEMDELDEILKYVEYLLTSAWI